MREDGIAASGEVFDLGENPRYNNVLAFMIFSLFAEWISGIIGIGPGRWNDRRNIFWLFGVKMRPSPPYQVRAGSDPWSPFASLWSVGAASG